MTSAALPLKPQPLGDHATAPEGVGVVPLRLAVHDGHEVRRTSPVVPGLPGAGMPACLHERAGPGLHDVVQILNPSTVDHV